MCIRDRLGRFHRVMQPGFNFMIPVLDVLAYKQNLKELAINIGDQTAITKDNVSLNLDGVLFVKVVDPVMASYKIENPIDAVKLLAVTSMRSEIGKMKLDRLFQERSYLNHTIVKGMAETLKGWGIDCLRYEILNIEPPEEIKKSMQYEAEAERVKRREVLISEGKMTAEINISEGEKLSSILRYEGEAESVNIITKGETTALGYLADAINNDKSGRTLQYILVQNYLRILARTLANNKVVIAPERESGAGGSGDLMAIAAMMMMNNQQAAAITQKQTPQPSQPQPAEKVTNTKDTSALRRENNPLTAGRRVDQLKVMKELNYYDDPILYSDDETASKTPRKGNAARFDTK
eukprot:TRINITY_DN48_c0_g8_i1.p2 TRINITY_DN48_c0_g8~~TRINITY_DN48_c0_g8_i1.p2  ORF type:complete len:351 (-),score=90.25 TRINITY_DN48_c0_g8_i1:1772-2824(-)